ncbi:MAG: ATP-binding cassette domain-containing protein [Nitrospira sp.]|nr:ATP-binding cassette domain-containing protein [Nitrospira sp.]
MPSIGACGRYGRRNNVELPEDLCRSGSITAQLRCALDPPSVTILFGPSGSGKTTILRCLAGLEQPEEGTISVGDELWFDATNRVTVPPQARRLGYMAQDYALFPNYTVEGNIAYGLTELICTGEEGTGGRSSSSVADRVYGSTEPHSAFRRTTAAGRPGPCDRSTAPTVAA